MLDVDHDERPPRRHIFVDLRPVAKLDFLGNLRGVFPKRLFFTVAVPWMGGSHGEIFFISFLGRGKTSPISPGDENTLEILESLRPPLRHVVAPLWEEVRLL